MRHVVLPWLREHLDPRITEHLCKSAAILRGDLTRDPAPPPTSADPVSEPSTFKLSVAPAIGFERRPEAIGTLPATAELSRSALAGRTLALRPWQPGDRIAPTGMQGRSRKLQDVFVTAKVPAAIRATLPVLVDTESNEVLWVPGYRVAESVAVESPSAPSWRFTLELDHP